MLSNTFILYLAASIPQSESQNQAGVKEPANSERKYQYQPAEATASDPSCVLDCTVLRLYDVKTGSLGMEIKERETLQAGMEEETVVLEKSQRIRRRKKKREQTPT